MGSRLGRVRIYNPGSTVTVDLTLTVSDLAEFPTVNSPAAFPLEGRTESRPWSVDVVDVGSTFSVNLSDSTGRMDVLGRLADFQTNDDGGGWVTKATGRVSDVFLNNDVASYQLIIGDERVLERQSRIFETSTTMQAFPASMRQPWAGFSTEGPVEGVVGTPNIGETITHVRLSWGRTADRFPSGVIAAVVNDIKPNPIAVKNSTTGEGNWNNLRYRQNGTDYEILAFESPTGVDNRAFTPNFVESFLGENADNPLGVWVASTSLGTAGRIFDVQLHMHGAEPSPGLPLHLFSSSGDARVGIHPFALARRIYNGDFGGQTIRISSSAFDDLENETRYYGRAFWRITEPANMAEWVEENIYKPYGALPFVDSQGRVAPRSIFLPSTGFLDSTAMVEFKSSNLVSHPTWEHSRQDMRNVLHTNYVWFQQLLVWDIERGVTNEAGDRIVPHELTNEVIHDNTTSMGRFAQNISVVGRRAQNILGPPRIQEFYAKELFDRWGDGPMVGEFTAQSTGDDVVPGDFVKITLNPYPNPQSTTGRGGTRYVQVMERTEHPTGITFKYLDVGPSVAALTAPAFSVTRSTEVAKHAVVVAITSLPTTDSSWQFRFALTATSESAPSSGSADWEIENYVQTIRDTTGTVTVSPLPSGQRCWVEARSVSRNRIRSAWSTVDSTTLETLPASTFVGQVGEYAAQIVPDWTVGTTEYPLEVYLDRSTTATFASSNFVATFPAGDSPIAASSGHGVILGNLSTATSSTDNNVLFGIRHIDSFGGAGEFESTSLTLSTTVVLGTLPAVRGIGVLYGASIA